MSTRVTWLPSTETDIASYDVERADNLTGAPWVLVASIPHDTGGANYDTSTGKFFYYDTSGDLTKYYRLIAVDTSAQASAPSTPFLVSAPAVVATPIQEPTVTLEDVRGFLRDVAGQVPGTGVDNIMFDLPEFSDADLRRATKFTVARWNVVAPISADGAAGVNAWILLIGIAEFLMRSEAFRQVRNDVPLQDGDVQSPGLDSKFQQYLAIAGTLKEEFEEKSRNFKITRNLNSAFGSLGSGYRAVSRFMHSS